MPLRRARWLSVAVAGLWRAYLQLGRSQIRWRRVRVELAVLIAVLALKDVESIRQGAFTR